MTVLGALLSRAELPATSRSVLPIATAQVGPGEASTNSVQSAAAVTLALERKLAEARGNLRDAESTDAATAKTAVGASADEIATRRVLLRRLVWLVEQQLSNISELETAKKRRAEATRQAENWTQFSEPRPYSILVTDRIRETIQTEQLRIQSGETALTAIEQLMTENRNSLSHAEEKIRQVQESLEGNADAGTVASLSWQREVERARSQVAAATLGVLDLERHLRREALAESRTRVGLLQRQLVVAEADTTFTQADLDRVIARIEAESQQFEDELATAESRAKHASGALDQARADSLLAQSRPEAVWGGRARAAEEVAAREAQLETAHVGVRILRLLLESENVERSMWETRFAAFHSRSVSTLRESERRLNTFTRRADLLKDYQRQQLEVFPSQIQLQETRIRELDPGSELVSLARERLEALRERDELLLRLVRRIEQVQRLGERWAEGVRTAEQRLPFFGRVQNLFSDTGSFLRKLWAFELFAAEDTIEVEGQKITGRRSVTLGKVAMAVLILGVGIWLTGLVARLTEPIIVRRLNIEKNQARLIRRWFRACMVVCLVMFSLVSVKIPLTVFAFAGGALAIGLGFGMQTLLKNFVSGLILLFERPFRVGDVLEVGGQRGTVTEIGLRSSVLQLWDGTETLIPNSSLLENNVSNWTYSDRKVRFSVTVGAAYGSDTRRVMQLLSDVADRHGLVEKEPKPQVFFTEFGDSALNFELRFWVDVIKSNAAQVSSDLRQMLAGAFEENGIVVAFPQRDLHLSTSRPLHVEIIPASGRDGVIPPAIPGRELNRQLPQDGAKS